MKATIRVANLDCPNCAQKLENKLKKIDGMSNASVNFLRQSILISYDTQEAYDAAVGMIGSFEDVRIITEEQSGGKRRTELVAIIASAVFLVAGLFFEYLGAGNRGAEITMYVCYALSYAIVGWKILWNTVQSLMHGDLFDENFLMTVASLGAIILGQYAEAAEVAVLYTLGEFLQSAAVGASRKSVAALTGLKIEKATVIDEHGEEISVEAQELRAGALICVKTGEKIAADGVLEEGFGVFDTKSLSGESVLREVNVGEEVLSGWINSGGVVRIRATKDYSDSMSAKIVNLVENCSERKAKSERFITKFSRIYTPTVCAIALLVAFIAPLFTQSYVENLPQFVQRALVFLVVSCPCALVISVPLAYFGGIGFAASKGILVKGSAMFDALAASEIAAFDKTGTITYGDFSVGTVYGANREQVLSLAAAAEKDSSHPLAAAFRKIKTTETAQNVKDVAGLGVECTIRGKEVLCGNAKWMEMHGISVEKPQTESTVVYVSQDGKFVGCVCIEDTIRENAAKALAEMKKSGTQSCYILTGDARSRAQEVADAVGADGVYSELLPNQKIETAKSLKGTGKLMFVGDGINDAPVLLEADVGVSMGGVGSDAAIEASDIVLMHDDLMLVPVAKRAARRTRKIVVQNIVFSIAVKVAVMILGLFGWIPLGVAVFADVGVMLLAVLNSFRTRIALKESGK